MFDPFRRTSSTLINSSIPNSNYQQSPNPLQNIMIQQQIFRIAKYILCTKVILVCSGGFINLIIKTEVSYFIVFRLKNSYSKFAMYLERITEDYDLSRLKVHAPSILAGVHATKVTRYRSAMRCPVTAIFSDVTIIIFLAELCK